MIRRRFLKQVSYAGGCATVVGLLLVGAILLVQAPRRSPVVIPSPTVAYAPVEVEEIFSVQHAGTVDIVARLRNRNAQVGIADYPITFVLEDAQGGELVRRQEAGYLLPGSLHYVAALNVAATNFARIRVEVPPEPVWQELPAGIRLPQLGAFLRGELETNTVGATQIQQQRGIANNASSYGVQRVEIVAVAFDAQRNVVGIGKTFLGELSVGEQREFTVQWPQPPRLPVDIVTSLSTNVFNEDNVTQVVGDPSSLR